MTPLITVTVRAVNFALALRITVLKLGSCNSSNMQLYKNIAYRALFSKRDGRVRHKGQSVYRAHSLKIRNPTMAHWRITSVTRDKHSST